MQREVWGTRPGFVIATVGSAVGLGNIWRFNYLVYSNGGGAFLIPYFVALFTAGISLLILELAFGHHFGGSAPHSFRKAKGSFEWVGWWSVLTGFIITMFYIVIISWSLVYLFKSFNLSWGDDPNAYFFGSVLELTGSPWVLGGFQPEILLCLLIIWLINWFIALKGVKSGIERANKIFLPLLWIMTVILIIRALTLPGSLLGIDWYLKPDFDRLFDYRVWLAAYGQVFFSLGLGMGIMTIYASYLPEKSDIVNNSFIVGLTDGAFSFMMGFAVFGTLGYMSHVTGQDIRSVVDQGIGLAFVVFPKAITLLPALNVFTAVVFFSCLVIAGLSSSISLYEAFTSSIMDKLGMDRKRAVNITLVIGFAGSLIYATRGGLFWLDIVDHFINVYGLLLVGLLEAVAIGWFFGADEVRQWANRYSEVTAGTWWNLSIKVITPVVLVLLIAMDIKTNLESPYGNYPLSALGLGLLVILAGIIASALLSRMREEKEL